MRARGREREIGEGREGRAREKKRGERKRAV